MNDYDVSKMKNMRLKGKTLQFIGDYYGITRERVRQLLVENYGTSLETDTLKRVENEVKEYQWDSATRDEDARIIARKIQAIYHPMRVNDPLSTLIT